MNTSRVTLVLGLATALAVSVGAYFLWRPEPPAALPAQPQAAPTRVDSGATATIAPAPAAAANPVSSSQSAPVESLAPSGAPAIAAVAGASIPQKAPYQPGPGKFINARDPLARRALSQVGVDPSADAYWVGAINDSSLSPKERQDLIEDLNEDGISDPSAPTLKDLAVISGRLQLIEQLLPSAMDKVNADAFREARKDLLQMRRRVLKQ
jgi:hypothetical protein